MLQFDIASPQIPISKMNVAFLTFVVEVWLCSYACSSVECRAPNPPTALLMYLTAKALCRFHSNLAQAKTTCASTKGDTLNHACRFPGASWTVRFRPKYLVWKRTSVPRFVALRRLTRSCCERHGKCATLGMATQKTSPRPPCIQWSGHDPQC